MRPKASRCEAGFRLLERETAPAAIALPRISRLGKTVQESVECD